MAYCERDITDLSADSKGSHRAVRSGREGAMRAGDRSPGMAQKRALLACRAIGGELAQHSGSVRFHIPSFWSRDVTSRSETASCVQRKDVRDDDRGEGDG